MKNLRLSVCSLFLWAIVLPLGCFDDLPPASTLSTPVAVDLASFEPNSSDLLGSSGDSASGEQRPFGIDPSSVGFPECEEEFCNCYTREDDPDPDDQFICVPGNDNGADICAWSRGEPMNGKSSFSLSICGGIQRSGGGWGCSYRDGVYGCEKFNRAVNEGLVMRFEKSQGRYTECKAGIPINCADYNPSWKYQFYTQTCWEASDFVRVTIHNANPPNYTLEPWPDDEKKSWLEVTFGGAVIDGPLNVSIGTQRSINSNDRLESMDGPLSGSGPDLEAMALQYCPGIQDTETSGSGCEDAIREAQTIYQEACDSSCVDGYYRCLEESNCLSSACGNELVDCCF